MFERGGRRSCSRWRRWPFSLLPLLLCVERERERVADACVCTCVRVCVCAMQFSWEYAPFFESQRLTTDFVVGLFDFCRFVVYLMVLFLCNIVFPRIFEPAGQLQTGSAHVQECFQGILFTKNSISWCDKIIESELASKWFGFLECGGRHTHWIFEPTAQLQIGSSTCIGLIF